MSSSSSLHLAKPIMHPHLQRPTDFTLSAFGVRLMAIVLIGSGLLWQSSSAIAQPPSIRRLAEFLSADVRDLDWERHSCDVRLSTLPEYVAQANVRAGFHSVFAKSENEPHWVQIDLGRVLPIELIALVPVSIVQESVLQNGYGFPVRFRVQVSVDPAFQQSAIVADSTAADFPNPGKYPVQFTGLNVSGRYVRVTATKLASPAARPCFALGEMLVLSEDRNVAAWRPVTSSGAEEAESRWSKEYLVDEQSILPLVHGMGSSRTNGFLSQSSIEASTEKWIELDLQSDFTIDEIRLIPARPIESADVPGWGMPERFRIDLATKSDFSDAMPYCNFSEVDVRHGVHHALVLPYELREDFSRGDIPPTAGLRTAFPSAPVAGRYLRLTVNKLDSRVHPSYLALSEIQVWSNGENVALKATVKVSDEIGRGSNNRWSPSFLVDDHSSRRKLISINDWLAQIERRRTVEEHKADVESRYRLALEDFSMHVYVAVTSIGVGLVLIVMVFAWRQHRRHRLQTQLLRTQIASDLHDDIGSNLGTIALLCQTINSESDGTSILDEGLREIRTIALETGDAMRDILWLMKESSTGLDEFVGRMRTMTTRMTQGFDVLFEAPDHLPHHLIGLVWRRNLFLSFKETLYNAVRHSKATSLVIGVRIDGAHFEVQVRDNGKGLPESTGGLGFGRGNIARRMEMLNGAVAFESQSKAGTTVTLRCPLPKPRDA